MKCQHCDHDPAEFTCQHCGFPFDHKHELDHHLAGGCNPHRVKRYSDKLKTLLREYKE